MCGRFSLSANAQTLVDFFRLPGAPDIVPRYNIAPSQDLVAVTAGAEGREWAQLRWGLVPSWAKDPRIGQRMINAKAETVAVKPAFRAAFARRRCLIPATGFYEWRPGAGGKQPFNIQSTAGELLTFAGIWEHWVGAGAQRRSCAILTTAANEDVREVHARMPVLLPRAAHAAWLDAESERPALEALLQPAPAGSLHVYPVSRHVNRPANDDARCVEPLAGDREV